MLEECAKQEISFTATELAQMFGVSPNRIGRIVNENGLKTPAFGVQAAATFRYNERGKEQIRMFVMAEKGIR